MRHLADTEQIRMAQQVDWCLDEHVFVETVSIGVVVCETRRRPD
jgi:hypothetical protein